jgi:hypothetical protein
VPVLGGVGDPDRLAVLDDVRKDPDLGQPGLVEAPGQRGLDPAELLGEVPQLARLKLLIEKVQYPVSAEGAELTGWARSPRMCPVGSIVVTCPSVRQSDYTVPT